MRLLVELVVMSHASSLPHLKAIAVISSASIQESGQEGGVGGVGGVLGWARYCCLREVGVV